MKLQETIKKVLREETEIPARVRRRLHYVDSELNSLLNRIYRPDKICIYRSGEEFVEVVMYATIENMYYTYFGDMDDDSKEWVKIFRFMEKYIKDKYGDQLKDYYHINCGN